MEITIEGLGWGICRIGARNVGWADVAAVYSDDPRGWNVEVQRTNVVNPDDLAQMVAEFRRAEGMDQ